MRLGITGADGFLAWHLRSYLHSRDDGQIEEVRLADRNVFSDKNSLEQFVTDLDYIAHLAGVNRAPEDQLVDGNILPAQMLVDALVTTNSSPTILFSNSTHSISSTTSYGKGKNQAAKILSKWASTTKNRFINLIVPHVFGEYCRPFYNSAVASFCQQILNEQKLEINPDGNLELVHAQDLAEQIVDLYHQDSSDDLIVQGYAISVPDVVAKLNQFYDEYINKMQIPDIGDRFTRNLFNTFRSYIDTDKRNLAPPLRTDNRGWLVESVKTASGGQCFVSSTHPGIVRGNHYHRRKVERFFVLQGSAQIKMRKLLTDEVIQFELNGDQPSFVDIPTLHTHNIQNTGDSELITLFWADEIFDPNSPDTYFEEVE